MLETVVNYLNNSSNQFRPLNLSVYCVWPQFAPVQVVNLNHLHYEQR